MLTKMIKDNKMTKGLRNLFMLALIVCAQQFVKAQANQNQKYLQNL